MPLRALLRRLTAISLRQCCNAASILANLATDRFVAPKPCLHLPLSELETKEVSQGESCTSLQRSSDPLELSLVNQGFYKPIYRERRVIDFFSVDKLVDCIIKMYKIQPTSIRCDRHL